MRCLPRSGRRGNEVLRLDSFAEATRDLGGYRAIEPNALKDSETLARIYSTDERMPPEDAEKQLTAAQRELLARWIRQGGEYATHWSFIQPRKELPDGTRYVRKSEAIDALIGTWLHKEGIDFAPKAELPTLARRVALVLTGLRRRIRQHRLSTMPSNPRGAHVGETATAPRRVGYRLGRDVPQLPRESESAGEGDTCLSDGYEDRIQVVLPQLH